MKTSISDDPTSRRQEMELTFIDKDGNTMDGLDVSIKQVDLDFLFSIEYGDISPQDFTSKYEQQYWDTGINTWRYGLYFLWSMIEPNQDDFRWWLDYPAMFCPEIQVGEQKTCTPKQWQMPNLSTDRMDRMFATADMGLYPPNHQGLVDGGNIPAWTDPADIDGRFKENYGDFLRAVVTHYKGTIDVYRIALESNFGTWNGGLDKKDYAWLTDWIVWQCDTIKGIDPGARISIDMIDMYNAFPDQDPQTLDWSVIGRPNPMWEMQFTQLLIDAGAKFDLIGIEYHPGWNNSLEQVDENLHRLEEFGKPIYVWEFFVPSEEEPQVIKSCTNAGVCPETGYSEAFQSEMALDFFKLIIENHPSVVGIEYLGLVDDPDINMGPEVPSYVGLLHSDGSPKQIYSTIQGYWFSLFVNDDLVTNSQGQTRFNAIPGWFEVTVNGQSIMIKITRETNGNIIQIPKQ